MLQKIEVPDLKGGVRSGGLQINDDWPGLFLRGDDALELLMAFQRIIEKYPEEHRVVWLFERWIKTFNEEVDLRGDDHTAQEHKIAGGPNGEDS